MNNGKKTARPVIELATFYVGNALCGMDILKIQEINKLMDMTRVPQAPEYVTGIINLRGQTVTIIDMARKLGLGITDFNDDPRNIIVNALGEHIGLLVKSIGDVVMADPERIETAPANMSGIQGRFFIGVYKTENKLIGILNVEEVLKLDKDGNKSMLNQ